MRLDNRQQAKERLRLVASPTCGAGVTRAREPVASRLIPRARHARVVATLEARAASRRHRLCRENAKLVVSPRKSSYFKHEFSGLMEGAFRDSEKRRSRGDHQILSLLLQLEKERKHRSSVSCWATKTITDTSCQPLQGVRGMITRKTVSHKIRIVLSTRMQRRQSCCY